jgi:hypothetical protein
VNKYYYELATLVYDQFGIDLYEKVEFKNHYLTVQDYLLGISVSDRIKNILSLIRSLPNKKEVMEFMKAAMIKIMQETLLNNPDFADFYKHRIKQV